MRTAWIGRARAVVLLVLAVAMVVDLSSFAALVGRSDPPGTSGPDEVTIAVVRSVADADCAGLERLLDPAADLPVTITRCLRGTSRPVEVDRLDVVSSQVDEDAATVVVALRSAGEEARLEAGLRRADDRWLLVSLAPVG